MAGRPLILPVALLLASAVSACLAEAPAGGVRRLGEVLVDFAGPPSDTPVARVDRPYFDADGRLSWDETPIPVAAEKGCELRARLRDPRVDERRCARVDGRQDAGATLVGRDASGSVTWQRPLVFRSGPINMELWLIGATPDGLVLSNLEVWSPSTGETVLPARTHSVGPEGRPVPDFQFSSSAAYDPRQKALFVFEADVTLVRREGGLYRVDPATGAKELWHDVSATLLGTYDSIESMAVSGDGRRLFLAQRREVRGPGGVSFAAFDLEARRLAFQERHAPGHYCSDPQVVVGTEGHVGFAYTDLNTRKHVLVHYRMAP